jgi:hypothetical protein
MANRWSFVGAILMTGVALAALTLFGTRQYGFNPSALLHMDVVFGETHDVAPGVVLYKDGGYDGMLYYEVARDLPKLLSGEPVSLDSPYRFQRVLLPLLVYGLSFGNVAWFPAVTLFLNFAAILGTFAVALRMAGRPSVHAFAVVFNPAMLVGLLYSLTEPLSAFFMMIFLARWQSRGRTVDWACVAALLLSLLARETTVFLIGLLGLWHVWKRDWKSVVLLGLTIALFAGWQYALVLRLGSLPFRTGGNIIVWPFLGPLSVVRWAFEDTGMKLAYRLSSLPLLAFVLATGAAVALDWKKKGTAQDVLGFTLAGLCAVMLSMDPHMWGALTSIGRVVTPFYPAYFLFASSRDTRFLRLLSWCLILFSAVAAVGIAYVRHPYVVS